jgi:hypothetical protein
MMLSAGWFALIVFVALAIVIAAPIILLTLWFADLKKGDLW